MEIKDSRIDAGKAFDWGRTSKEYAKYRDIYPDEFYRRILEKGLCVRGQNVLDIGTGTGVLPRNLYRYGADWTGTDISPEQIEQAKLMSESGNMKIRLSTNYLLVRQSHLYPFPVAILYRQLSNFCSICGKESTVCDDISSVICTGNFY